MVSNGYDFQLIPIYYLVDGDGGGRETTNPLLLVSGLGNRSYPNDFQLTTSS